MALLARKTVILAKIESVYDTDPTPTGAANAILVRNLTLTDPQNTEFASRDLIRPYLGNSENLPNDFFSRMEFEVELAGSGTAGTAPGYGPLLRAAGFSQNLFTTPNTGTAQSGGASTIQLASGASAVDDFYIGTMITLTGGIGSGQKAIITAYVGSTKTATIRGAWDIAPDNTTTYNIPSQAVYALTSASFSSLTVYANCDGVQHKMTGARCSASFSLSVRNIPVIRFSLLGNYQEVTDVALPTAVFTAFQKPLTVNKTNTPYASIHGYAACLSEITIDLANELTPRALVNCIKQVLITNRAVTGSVKIEKPTVATKDYWDIMQAATLGRIAIEHGVTAGNIVDLMSASVQIRQPQVSVEDGIYMLAMTTEYVPSSLGNDEFTLVVR